jgi:dihydropteroate synthase
LPASGDTARTATVSAPRSFAGLALDRTLVMGVVNVTPDSFSDGGDHFDTDKAIEHGLRLQAEGADILDIGGESMRPGAVPISIEEEVRRIAPVVAKLAASGAIVSIDTRHAAVMRAAVRQGARIVNDVTALTGDPDSLKAVAESGVGVILMHMQGEPQTMQAAPRYRDAPSEIFGYLAERVAACRAAEIPPERIAVDPGIGFGKTVRHNLEIIARLDRLHALGVAVAIGVSRKAFIGALSRHEAPKDRVAGSLAAALAAVTRGADIVRVHDVAATVQALAVWRAIGITAP